MTTHLKDFASHIITRILAGSEEGLPLDAHDDGHSDFGVHIEYQDLYSAVVFLSSIYCAGQFASRVLTMPSLVGEICCGILLGPQLADYVPNAEAWVLLGEIG